LCDAIQLLYGVQFYALSDALPYTCRRLYLIFKSAPAAVKADYFLGRHIALQTPISRLCIVGRALRYPLCTQGTLEALLRHPNCPPLPDCPPELPRRLFRLAPRSPSGAQEWKDCHEPLPFLRYLFSHPRIPAPDPDSHSGYPLTRAVLAGFRPLVSFLLDAGASPRRKDGLAVMVAIQRKDLSLVKQLVEPNPLASRTGGSSAKRRRLQDRVELNSQMLRTAVKCGASDIADWLMKDKGCVPDMPTLVLLAR
jgi:hypothetical protein